ncbi:HEAT repeat domain-containing protein, partial [Candidatus Sumerlaeota bacterium]|nr:HEAT repeat domain-containing protein [Candidatus Sumerlaeota bacterium]
SARKERPGHDRRRFVAPEGFDVEEMASPDLVGSVVNMTFDYKGRPALAIENAGIVLLEDTDHDGKYDTKRDFCTDIKTAHGMHFIAPGDLIVNANGPQGAGLYRLTDTNNDDLADKITFFAGSQIGGIGEHGPHAIQTGYDGYLYVEYGNHSYPDVTVDPQSPSRGLQEDHLLPRYVDPRGHATHIMAPGGTIHRFEIQTNSWAQYCGGFRNAFDFDIDEMGEIFTFDSDMEWDVGLPWYRPIRLVHCIPGGDYGWRTGSNNNPSYYIDHLPPMDEMGRGSPVGIAFNYHYAYPEKYWGALFLGDWSRGRILVNFRKPAGASFDSGSVEFVLGEPLNVTDLEFGPDGNLYFATGGRSTTGGLYRARYTASTWKPSAINSVENAIHQPMRRSAWGSYALEEARKKLGADWESGLTNVVKDRGAKSMDRVRALELLQVHGPKPDIKLLTKLADDGDPLVRASALLLLGTFPFEAVQDALTDALADKSALVQRRACESLVRAGLNPYINLGPRDHLPRHLIELLDHEDRFVRYAARLALTRVNRDAWIEAVKSDRIEEHPRGALEGLLVLIQTEALVGDSDIVFGKLLQYSHAKMDADTLVAWLRTAQLAYIRDMASYPPGRPGFMNEIGPWLLAQYPSKDGRINRQLELLMAYMQTPGSIPAMLAQLGEEKSQEDQIATVYALRVIKTGWTEAQRKQIVEWFDRGRQFGGAASMEGYIEDLWQSVLANLPTDERRDAEERKSAQLAERAKRAQALAEKVEGDRGAGKSDLAQMGFQEISEYLEFDPMTYERGNAEKGKLVFHRAKCANCHIFGSEGKGGGPDLSNVVKRFRRREILESIMYPSKVISDQYQAVNVDLKNNDVVNGFLAGESDTTLSLITSTGDKMEIPKDQITGRRPSTVSIMPEGLLDTMSLADLVDLITFLEKGSGL